MVMDFHKRHQEGSGYIGIIDDRQICEFIRFGVVRLNDGQAFRDETKDEETCLVVLGGRCTVASDDQEWQHLGRRKNVFDGRPHSAYIPIDSPFSITGEGECSVAVCRAPASERRQATVIPPEDVKCRTVGRWNWKRNVCDIMGNDSTVPERLIVGETYNPPGNWSSSPPHKHDVDNPPQELKLEEVYYYRLSPPQGFGLQRVYTGEGDLDEAYVVKDGDTVAIPSGYHPVCAAPGYQLYYLWMLAGGVRMMKPNDDPDHAWVKNCEAVIAEIE
jgi:5-deoxy-glucuronate isomerase